MIRSHGRLSPLMSWPVSWSSLLPLGSAALMLSGKPCCVGWPGFQNVYETWANLTLYLLYFVTGYFILCSRLLALLLDKQRWDILSLAVPALRAFVLGLSPDWPPFWLFEAFILVRLSVVLTSWIGRVGLRWRWRAASLIAPIPILRYGRGPRAAALPVHQPLLVGGWPGFCGALELGITAKFLSSVFFPCC